MAASCCTTGDPQVTGSQATLISWLSTPTSPRLSADKGDDETHETGDHTGSGPRDADPVLGDRRSDRGGRGRYRRCDGPRFPRNRPPGRPPDAGQTGPASGVRAD